MKSLSCHNLTYSRPLPGGGAREILRETNCRFPAGNVAVIGGAIGAGKSTLVHLLAGLMRPTSGEVMADGEPVSRWVTAHKDVWRRKVGIVFQHAHLMGGLTAFENVILPLIPRPMSLSKIRAAGMRALEFLEANHLAGKAVRSLSGGEHQMIAIARAICAGPEVILADEPTAHQDDQSATRVLTHLRNLADTGCIVILVAHDPRIAASGAGDRFYVLRDGMLGPAA